ncbi:calmodulin-binding protein 60 D-like [Papaver somniferum]|uniref:calmodulin-binding protein 60 D-like n=1 Tax=Papaver somniferum TaxID=3469 RepID=UPI000E70381B|nr:calmodulin-binding protein 60 D-like [Papaver somniferum]
MDDRQRRYIERSNSMLRRESNNKRGLDDSEDAPSQPDTKKRPALASVIVEALKMDSLQKLCSSLEPILRRVVSEEVERALAKMGPASLNGRSSPKRIEGPDGRNLQLQFRSRLSLPLFTGGKVEGEQGAAIHVVLLDANTGHVVTVGPESGAKLDVVVLEGDFSNEDNDNWTQEEFESRTVKEREGKRPLLTGDLFLTLKEGVGTLGDLTFTDNSSWIRSRKFRLGLKVSSGYCEGLRIREAKTEAFTVKDHRGELYKKHYPPALNDDVWRLEKIGKDGSFHKRLNKSGIYTVEDFLRLVVRDSPRLRSVLGSGMSNKMWDVLIEHAKTCVLSGKHYVFYDDATRNVGVVFNNIYELNGLIAGGQYRPADSLSDSEKVYVDALVKRAYENWTQVIEYDGQALLSFYQNKELCAASESEVQQDHHNQQGSLLTFPVSVPPPQPSPPSGLAIGGHFDHTPNGYLMNSQQVNSNVHTQFDGFVAPQNQLSGASHQPQMTGQDINLVPGQLQSSSLGFQTVGPSVVSSNLTSFSEDFLTAEDIRMRSHQILENEDDMQQLLRLYSMGNHNSVNPTDDIFHFPSSSPFPPSINYKYDEDNSRLTSKSVVGWLKIKAALRWGFFIRKQAAERRRAQIVELDDE